MRLCQNQNPPKSPPASRGSVPPREQGARQRLFVTRAEKPLSRRKFSLRRQNAKKRRLKPPDTKYLSVLQPAFNPGRAPTGKPLDYAAPRPGAVSTEVAPPGAAWMMLRQMASPRPVPLALVVKYG